METGEHFHSFQQVEMEGHLQNLKQVEIGFD
jgi:hypothetical protein